MPLFIIAGIVVEYRHLHAITLEFLGLKRRFFPGEIPDTGHQLDAILHEIKGANLRKAIRSGSTRRIKPAIGFLDGLVRILETYNAYITGRVWIKGISRPMDDRTVYTMSMQSICGNLQQILNDTGKRGMVIADSRRKNQNVYVSHSIFTQMYTWHGNNYPRIVEMPTYGHATNHAVLQIADLLCSSLLFALAVETYCRRHTGNLHVHPDYSRIKQRYGQRLKKLQYRYKPDGDKWRGGIVVSDSLTQRSGKWLFE